MDNKNWNADEFFGARELSFDDLEGIAGGITTDDLSPEDRARFFELYDKFNNSSTSQEFGENGEALSAFIDEMEKKYDQ